MSNLELSLNKEIEKTLHFFNSYIIANNLTQDNIENGVNFLLFRYLYLDEHMLFFIRVVAKSSIFHTYEMRQYITSKFYIDFNYYKSFTNVTYSGISIDNYFNINPIKYIEFLTISLLKNYYTPYLSYNQWKKLYDSHSINS